MTLVGGAGLLPGDLDAALAIAPLLVAADGAANSALEAGRVPDAVIGDFDSLGGARQQIPADRLHHVPEQSSTDFDKCLRHIDAPLILAVGFTDRRIDHQLAVFHTLVVRREQCCVVIGSHDIVFHAPERLILDLEAGTRVSLFPLAPVRGRSEGLTWPIGELSFAPTEAIGTSNRAEGRVTLEFDGPGMLVILPRPALPRALAALGHG